MAEEKTDPLAGLTEEARRHLEGMEKEITEAERDLEAMESLGLDVSVLREKIAWARKARDIILNRLGPK